MWERGTGISLVSTLLVTWFLLRDATATSALICRLFASGGDGEPHWYMEEKEVTERVMHLLKHFDGIDESKLSPTADLEKDLKLDSLDRVEFVFALEQEFNLTIEDDAAEKLYEVTQ